MFVPVSQPDILKEILHQIERNVLEGKLKKGDKLPAEREWAATLGISRTTLREAIKSLELIGLVKCTQGDSIYITNNPENSFTELLSILFHLEGGTLKQIHSFRKSIETAVIQEAAACITDGQIKMLEAICDKLEQDDFTFEEFFAVLDQRFHRIIMQVSSNPLLIIMMNAAENLFTNQIWIAREKMKSDPGASAQINSQHREIIEALRSADQNNAARAMQKHMDYTAVYYE